MCCRFLLLKEHLRAAFEALGLEMPASLASRYNIAPGTAIPAIRQSPRPPRHEAATLHWGLVPSWAKDADASTQLVNARAESLAAKPSFRDAFRQRRCIIPASGFYEWAQHGRVRTPWLFQRPDAQPFGLAGLWETWRAPDGAVLESCAVITTEPNDLMRPIHHRMPALLAPENFAAWLDPQADAARDLAPLLQPARAGTLTATALSERVNHIRHDDPACLTLASEENSSATDEPQLSLEL